jgi:hypothetical protein
MTNNAFLRSSLGIVALTAAAVLLPGGSAEAAGGCSSGHFCAFDNAGYTGLLLDSTAPRGSNQVSVANDRTSSGSNRTGNSWVGKTRRTGLPDQTLFTFGANTDVSYIGDGANDKIDFFDVR